MIDQYVEDDIEEVIAQFIVDNRSKLKLPDPRYHDALQSLQTAFICNDIPENVTESNYPTIVLVSAVAGQNAFESVELMPIRIDVFTGQDRKGEAKYIAKLVKAICGNITDYDGTVEIISQGGVGMYYSDTLQRPAAYYVQTQTVAARYMILQ